MSTGGKKVSVVLNTYRNPFDHLRVALASYLEQEDVDVQLIISTVEHDSSISFVEDHYGGDERVEMSILAQSEHPGRGPEGIFAQLNHALNRVEHPWWTYASGNDKALPTKLSDEVDLCVDRGCLVCYSAFLQADDGMNVQGPATFHEYDPKRHLAGNFVSDCALVHTSLLTRYAPFRIEHGNSAYWDFWLRIYEGEGNVFAYNPTPEWIYRDAGSSRRTRKRSLRRVLRNSVTRERMLASHRRRISTYPWCSHIVGPARILRDVIASARRQRSAG